MHTNNNNYVNKITNCKTINVSMLIIFSDISKWNKMLILIPANNYTQSRGRKMSYSMTVENAKLNRR